MKKWIAWLLLPFLAPNSAIVPTQPDFLVAEIRIFTDQQTQPVILTADADCSAVLQYLRGLELTESVPAPPLPDPATVYTLQIRHSTGRMIQYRQVGAEYLSKNHGPWFHLEPEQGAQLPALIAQIDAK